MAKEKLMQVYTQEEISEAYGNLIYAQGLINFVLRAGFNLNPECKAEIEGSLISIFSILEDYLKKAEEIMFDLTSGTNTVFPQSGKRRMKNDRE